MTTNKAFFLVTSRGLTASTWFSNAINFHPDMFSTHGRDNPSRTKTTKFDLNDNAYRQERLAYETWQRSAPVEEFCHQIIDQSGEEDFAGNVHGYMITELNEKLGSVESVRIPGFDKVRIMNMLRHPVSFVNSYSYLVEQNFNRYPEKFRLEHLPRIDANIDLINRFKISRDNIKMVGFVEGCVAINKMYAEQERFSPSHILMERLVTERDYFKQIVIELSSGNVEISEDYLDNVFGEGAINSHASYKRPQSSGSAPVLPLETWQSWSDVEKEIFSGLATDAAALAPSYGYDMPE